MKVLETACREETRRRLVRDAELNGFDYLEVSDDQRTLTVYFLGKAPEDLGTEHLRIDGGIRVRDVQITRVRVHREDDPELDDRVELVVDRPGDFSTYTLKAVELDEHGRPTGGLRPDFDPRYAELDFTFKAGCPSNLDCVEEPSCPPVVGPEIELNYLAKDYATFRQLIFDRLALLIPEWRERSVPDIGIALVELMAYAGDHLSYYQDAVATEAYLDTARHRISVRRHARLVDYVLHEGCNARAFLVVEAESDERLDPRETFFVTSFPGAPQGSHAIAETDLPTGGGTFEVFEPLVADPGQLISIHRAHNRIAFFTWGNRDCCLPLGATCATLVDAWADAGIDSPGHPEYVAPAPSDEDPQPRPRALHLRPGDVVIFEEVLGPRTGLAEDADPSHRHAVRLTRVTPSLDPLSDQPLIEVEWAEDDALPFALCISTLGTATPTCAYLDDVSVARGNVILVDHGRTVGESLGQVEETSRDALCEGEGRLGDVLVSAKPFRPILSKGPVAFSQGLPDGARRRLGDWPDQDDCGRPRRSPASALLRQDPRSATAQVWLRSPVMPSNGAGAATANGRNHGTGDPCSRIWKRGARFVEWLAMPDLLGSRWQDHHFVVEVDDESRAHLRFGDGDVGREPRPGDAFCARYRIARGSAGNVGAETINHVVFRAERVEGTTLRVRNPMPAQGGVDPESLTEAKLLAPTAFRTMLRRAIAEDDYARLAERHPDVQRASATFRWTGSWYEALVAVDPRGAPEPDADLLSEVRSCLRPSRRIGHDLRVVRATSVPLDVELEVCVSAHHLRSDVRSALQRMFGVRDLPGGGRGLFHPDELTFGQAVYLSALVAAAQAVPGVESVSVTRLQRLYEPPRGEIGEGRLMLDPTEIARLDNDPAREENGVLRLELVGGR